MPIPPALTRVLLCLIAVTCLPELILIAADLGLVGSPRWRGLAYQNGAFWTGLLYDWRPNYPAQPWLMFLSYAFLHAGPGHLAGNMLMLWLLAPRVVRRMGAKRFLLLYLGSALGGAVCFGLLAPSPQPMVGASGAIFGLLGVLLFWHGAARWRGHRSLRPVWGALGALVLLNALFWAALGGVLAWQTHLGGFLAGVMLAALQARFAKTRS